MSTPAPTLPVLALATGTLSNADDTKLLRALQAALAEQAGPVKLDLAGVVSFSNLPLKSSLSAIQKELSAFSCNA